MYVVIVEFTARDKHFENFLLRVRQQAKDSLELESGCRVFDVCIDPARDNFVFLYEVYSNREAFRAHLESAHFKDFDATVKDWIDDKKVSLLERL